MNAKTNRPFKALLPKANHPMPINSNKLNQKGQGLIEYLLIVSFVAIAGITVMQFVGQSIRYKFAQIANSIGSNTSGIRAPRAEQGLTEKKDINTLFNDN